MGRCKHEAEFSGSTNTHEPTQRAGKHEKHFSFSLFLFFPVLSTRSLLVVKKVA